MEYPISCRHEKHEDNFIWVQSLVINRRDKYTINVEYKNWPRKFQ